MTDHPTERDAVRSLQRYLRRLSYENEAILPIPIDGIFETRTRDALSAFQRSMGLPVTGRADKRSWDHLFAEYGRVRREEDRRVYADFFPRSPVNYETTPGETGAFILLLQFILDELRVIYDSLPPFAQSGVFDTETSAAVREFQRIGGLEQSGRVNRELWNRLSEEYNAYATENRE